MWDFCYISYNYLDKTLLQESRTENQTTRRYEILLEYFKDFFFVDLLHIWRVIISCNVIVMTEFKKSFR